MAKKTDMNQKARCDNARNTPAPLSEASTLFSDARTGTVGKRQTYHIHDLIAKLRGYAYWERQRISEVVNYALEQFFEDKEIRVRPSKNVSLKKRRSTPGIMTMNKPSCYFT